jgi:hypothetical protein
MAQTLLPSRLVPAPHLMFGVKGYVRSVGPKVLLATPGDDSSSEQVPHHVPLERLIGLVPPHFMRRFGPRQRAPVCGSHQVSPFGSLLNLHNAATPAGFVQPRIRVAALRHTNSQYVRRRLYGAPRQYHAGWLISPVPLLT